MKRRMKRRRGPRKSDENEKMPLAPDIRAATGPLYANLLDEDVDELLTQAQCRLVRLPLVVLPEDQVGALVTDTLPGRPRRAQLKQNNMNYVILYIQQN